MKDVAIAENEYGTYSIVGVSHTAKAWKEMEETLMEEADRSDFVVIEGVMNEETTVISSFHKILSLLTESSKDAREEYKNIYKSVTERMDRDIYSVDVFSKSNLSEAYLLGERLWLVAPLISNVLVSFPPTYFLMHLAVCAFFLKSAGRLPYFQRLFHGMAVDYRNVVATTKTTLLSKEHMEECGERPHSTLIYGRYHVNGMREYLSDIDLMKRQLKSYRYHPATRLLENDRVKVNRVDEGLERHDRTLNPSGIYEL